VPEHTPEPRKKGRVEMGRKYPLKKNTPLRFVRIVFSVVGLMIAYVRGEKKKATLSSGPYRFAL
jgi:hypothetical protein